MEAIKTNNGADNPINLKHYKQQIKIFKTNIELGYTASEALIRSAQECAKQNPSEIIAPKQDLERLSIVVQDIRSDRIDAKVDATVGLSVTAKGQIKVGLKKAKYTPAEESKALLRLINQVKPAIVAPSISSTPEVNNIQNTVQNPQGKKLIATKTSTSSPSQRVDNSKPYRPFNNSNNPTVPVKVEVTSDKGFDWFQTVNQEAIQDTLMQFGIIFTVAGVATIAGIKATKALYKKYQAFESTLPNISNDDATRIFWENVDKMKSNYRANQEGDMLDFEQRFGNILDNNNSTDVKQLNINFLENRPKTITEQNVQPTTQAIELKPKLGQKWSRFIAGFRKQITKRTKALFQPIYERNLLHQTKKREKGVIDDLAKFAEKKEHTKQAHISRIIFNIRSLYSYLLLGTQDQYELGSKTLLQEDIQRKVEDKLRMNNFEIPFVPDLDNATEPEEIKIPESIREFSNFDIEAALILAKDNLYVARKESKYAQQAKKAVDFINQELAKHNQNAIFERIKTQCWLPENIEELNISWDREPHKQIINSEFNSVIKGENQSENYTFENYFKILNGLKSYFQGNTKIQNALNIIIEFTKDQDVLLQSQNTLRSELFSRSSTPSIENLNGKCEEEERFYDSLSKEFLNKFTNLTFSRSIYIDKNELKFKSQVEPLVEKFGNLIFGTKYPDKNQKGYNLNTLNFEVLNSLLDKIKELADDYNIPTNKHELTDNCNNFLDIDILERLIFLNNKVARKLQLSPNTLKFAQNIYEVDPDPYFNKGIPQFNCHTKTRKYPTSLMFPGVLEKEAQRQHINDVCARFGLSLWKAYNALSNPLEATEEEIFALNTATKILNDPRFKYRPFRKANQNIPQKPITIQDIYPFH